MKKFVLSLFLITALTINVIPQSRWNLESDGSITWILNKGEAHTVNIEMSGRFISMITT